jgi:hypothetical protein
MSVSAYPLVLPAPIVPGAVPCFRLTEPAGSPASSSRQAWDDRCTQILLSDQSRSNAEVADLIEGLTGMRFGPSVITRHRRALGLARPRRNEWTSALRRWKPWQGHLAGKS